jgi:aminoglycoside phosphotransferase (APT) family kinase protein
MSFVEGSTHIPEGLEHERIEIMAAALAQIHTLSLSELPRLPRRDEPWPELLEYLPDGNEWQELRQRLTELEVPSFDDARRLLHGDFWPENLLWRDGQIAAILDWEDSAVGDRHSDVAAARVELRYLFGKEIMDRFTQAYLRHLPIDRTRLMLWQIYVAAAAQKYMGEWGLPAQREAHMREQALASVREACHELLT